MSTCFSERIFLSSSSPADIKNCDVLSSPLRVLTQLSCEGRGEGVEGEGAREGKVGLGREGAREEKVGLRRGGGREG